MAVGQFGHLGETAELISSMRIRFVAGCLTYTGAVLLLSTSLFAQQAPQPIGATQKLPPLHTEIEHIGAAEVKSFVNEGFYPSLQPEVYWHDSDWKIDLKIPPNPPNEKIPYSLNIHSSSGESKVIELDNDFAQIDSITRSPGNKAIIIGEFDGDTQGFSVVDLELGKTITTQYMYDPSVSPNGRFLVFDAWYPPRSEAAENQYTLYDTLKTFNQNLCGYWDNSPKYRSRNDEGILIYPPKVGCTNGEDDTDDNIASNYTWAPDSSRIVFADVKNGVMSLVLVTMPVGLNDLPQTSIYPLVGAENICAGAVDATGKPFCDNSFVHSLTWNGNTVEASFLPPQTGNTIKLAIPVCKFTLIGK